MITTEQKDTTLAVLNLLANSNVLLSLAEQNLQPNWQLLFESLVPHSVSSKFLISLPADAFKTPPRPIWATPVTGEPSTGPKPVFGTLAPGSNI